MQVAITQFRAGNIPRVPLVKPSWLVACKAAGGQVCSPSPQYGVSLLKAAMLVLACPQLQLQVSLRLAWCAGCRQSSMSWDPLQG